MESSVRHLGDMEQQRRIDSPSFFLPCNKNRLLQIHKYAESDTVKTRNHLNKSDTELVLTFGSGFDIRSEE